MKKETAGVIISVMTALVSGVIVEAMPNLVLRIFFIIGVCLTLALYLLRQKIRWQWKDIAIGVVGTITALILVISVAVGGSDHFWQQIFNFMGIKTETEETQEAEAQQVIAMQEAQIAELNDEIKTLEEKIDVLLADAQEYEDLELQMDSLGKELKALSDGFSEYQFWSGMENQEEAEEIYQKILELVKVDGNDIFPDLKEDKREVELFYKVRLTDKEYHYCNIISALEMYGVDCEKLAIDEYQLALWDIETLFIHYSMYKKAAELEKGVTFEEVTFKYNDYRISMSEYSDTFDYGGWRQHFPNYTADEILASMDRAILRFYKKLNLNFNTQIK